MASVSRHNTSSHFSLLPSFLANLETIALRLQMGDEVTTRMHMIQAFINTRSHMSIPNIGDIKKLMRTQADLNVRTLSIIVLETDFRSSLGDSPGYDAMHNWATLWTEIEALFLRLKPKSAPSSLIECLANAVVCIRVLKDLQSTETEVLVEKVVLDLKNELTASTLLGFFLIRQKLYRLAERILAICVAKLLLQKGASKFALFIATTELVNCRNLLGMVKAGSEIAESVLSQDFSAIVPGSQEVLSLQIAYSDSLIGQGMFEQAEGVLQETIKATANSSLVIMGSLRLSKLKRRTGHNDQATDRSSYLWNAVSHLDLSTVFLGTYCVEESSASVSLPDDDDIESMRKKKDLLDFCMEKIKIFSDQGGFTQHESVLTASKDLLLRRIEATETNVVPHRNDMFSLSIVPSTSDKQGEHLDTLQSVNSLVESLAQKGQYAAAEELYRQALAGREKALGLEHIDTLQSASDLATNLAQQGQYAAAEQLHRRALIGREKALGPEHPHTLQSVHGLGETLAQQGQYAEAILLLRRALTGRERVLGPEHPDTLQSVHGSGKTLAQQGQYVEAILLLRRAIRDQEKVLGSGHPDTLQSLNGLGEVLLQQGQYATAKELHLQALEVQEKVLGLNHPNTLKSVNSLAMALAQQGQYVAAEELYRRALREQEKALGPSHPDTLESLVGLSGILCSQGQYIAAEQLQRQALKEQEKVLGPEHPHTLQSLNCLSSILCSQGQYAAGKELCWRALAGREKALGSNHPDTLRSVNNVAIDLTQQCQYIRAEELYQRAFTGREKTLGPDHPDTLRSVNDIAINLTWQGQYVAAGELYQRALTGREKTLGPDHPDTLQSVNDLAINLTWQDQFVAAGELFQRALTGREKTLGPDHPDTLQSVNDSAINLTRQGKYAAAEQLHQRALAGREKVLGPHHPDTLQSAEDLAATTLAQSISNLTKTKGTRLWRLRQWMKSRRQT
jgi:tetratricopeptide (TPR) repeat protein